MKNIINWKLFFVLLAACIVGSICVIPYQFTLTSAEVEVSILIVILSAVVNGIILFAIAVFLGLLLSKQIGLENGGFRAPVLEGILNKENKAKEFKDLLLPSIGLGVFAGVLIILFSLPFNDMIPELQLLHVKVEPWKGFLASFYGGIAEEVLLRLFLVSLLVWITSKIKKNKNASPSVFGIWLSIILAAIVFGLGHLPVTAQILPLNGLIIFRAVLLNGIGGIIFGWLFWRKGLESAMISHFSADIVLHVITPIVISIF